MFYNHFFYLYNLCSQEDEDDYEIMETLDEVDIIQEMMFIQPNGWQFDLPEVDDEVQRTKYVEYDENKARKTLYAIYKLVEYVKNFM